MTRRALQIEIGEIAFEGFDRGHGPEATQALERELARQIARAAPGRDPLSVSIARAVQQRLLR
jgi:hypothetical protein